MLLTDESGAANQMAAYTAFGEMVDPNRAAPVGMPGHDPNLALPTRYRYAGGWGYEDGLITLYGANPNLPPITLQHVGARWYDPGIGRFVQRDPIGIAGGLNCYAYVRDNPLRYCDPSGLDVFEDIDGWIDWVINGPPMAGAGAATGTGMAVNYKYRLGIGRAVNRATVIEAGAWIGWNLGKGILACIPIDRPIGRAIGTVQAGAEGTFDGDLIPGINDDPSDPQLPLGQNNDPLRGVGWWD